MSQVAGTHSDTSSPLPDAGAKMRRYLPWLVATALFMENLDATIINTAVPAMAESLEVLPLTLKSVLTSYTLSLAVFIPISGWMADRFGTKRIFQVAVWLFLLGSLACGLAPDIHFLVAARVLQGVGGAMMTPVGRLALVRTFPRSEMLRTMNYVIIPAMLGPLLGPVTGGLIVHWLPWRVIFFVNVPLAILGLVMIGRFMPDYRDTDVAPLDRAGFFLFCSGIALLSYVLEVFGEHSHAAIHLAILTCISILLLLAYVWHARRVSKPMLQLNFFKVRTFRISVLGGFVTRLGFGGMPFLLPLLYQIGLGYPAWQAGLLTMPQALAAMGMKVISRSVMKRFGHRRILLSNTILMGLTMMMFTQIGIGTSVPTLLALAFAQGFFASLQFTAVNSLVYADIDDSDASKVGSIASTSQQLSLSFGVASGSLTAGWFLGNLDQTIAAETIPALHKAFFVLGATTMLSGFAFLGLHPNDGNNISNRQPLPEPRFQIRADSRAVLSREAK